MSLNYQLGKIKNWETVTKKGENMNPVTEGLIFSTMAVGLGEITEKNLDEWMLRLAFSDKLFGTTLKHSGEDRPFTREEVVAHIGLKANVSNEPRKAWMKRMSEHFCRDEIFRMAVVARKTA